MAVTDFAYTVPDDPRPEVNSLISDAVLKARVEKILAPPKPQSFWKRNLDQVALVVLGFFLTWGVGTSLTNKWERSRVESSRQIEQERRDTDARITAFTDFLGTISEQHARSSLVDEAIKHGAPIGDLAALIKSEQEIFAKSQNKTGVLTFTIRELVPPEIYEKITNAMERGLIKPLREASINHGYMYYEISNRRTTEWNIRGLSPQLSVCSAALTHAIWYNAIAPQRDGIAIEKKKNSLTQMEEDCKNPSL